jgi:hypothetical protein
MYMVICKYIMHSNVGQMFNHSYCLLEICNNRKESGEKNNIGEGHSPYNVVHKICSGIICSLLSFCCFCIFVSAVCDVLDEFYV